MRWLCIRPSWYWHHKTYWRQRRYILRAVRICQHCHCCCHGCSVWVVDIFRIRQLLTFSGYAMYFTEGSLETCGGSGYFFVAIFSGPRNGSISSMYLPWKLTLITAFHRHDKVSRSCFTHARCISTIILYWHPVPFSAAVWWSSLLSGSLNRHSSNAIIYFSLCCTAVLVV